MKVKIIFLLILVLILCSSFLIDNSLPDNKSPDIRIPEKPKDLRIKKIADNQVDQKLPSDFDDIEIKNEITFENFYAIYLKEFFSFEEAENEAKFLIKKGFKVYIKPSKDHSNFRLFIGPYVNKESLEVDRKKLFDLTQKKGSVVDYSY